jgi:nucleoside phosphorylase
MKIALFSAFPHELKEIVRNIGATKPLRKNSFEIAHAEYSSREIIIVQAGIGIRNAENALKYVVEEYAPEVVVSSGFGGALYDGARIGEVVWASHALFVAGCGLEFADLQDGRDMFERLSGTLPLREGSIVTLDGWKNKADVRKMVPENFRFPVCDMETFPLAKISLERGLRFFAFRSITDRNDEEIPSELLGVSDESGRYRLSRALKLLLSRPALIPESIKLGVHSYIAGRSLWRTLSALISEL